MSDIRVEQKPVNVIFSCDFCDADTIYPYSEFTSTFGEPCDWIYTKIECLNCKKENEIEYWEFD